MAHVSDIRVHGFDFFGRVETLRVEFMARRTARKVYRTTFNELSELSGRELADLGLHHSQLRRIAYEAAYGA